MNNLFNIACSKKEWNTAAYILDHWAAEFLEGDISSSMVKFNNNIKMVPQECLEILKNTTPFSAVKECCTQNLRVMEGQKRISIVTIEGDILKVSLPEGIGQKALISMAASNLDDLIGEGSVFAKDIKINGRITTGMCLMMGHKLAHVAKSVSIFDPKENDYILCIKH